MTLEHEQGNTQNNTQVKQRLTTLLGDDITQYWLDALIESADDAIISKTLDGIISSWNKGAQRIFGYTAEEVIGKPVLILIPPDHHNEEPTILKRIRAGERIEHYETVRKTKDGRLIDISLTVSPIKDASGKIIGASKIARDITDLKQAEKQIQASEERYRTLFNSIDEGFCIIEMIFDDAGKPVDYRFLEINPAFEKLTGIPAEEALRGTPVSHLVPNLEERWYQLYGNVALTGEPISTEENSDAMERWFDVSAFRVGGEESKKVAILFNNVTERKKGEQERERLLKQLEAERVKLDYLFTKAPAFVATVRGPEHVFELTNPAYLQLIGHRNVIGKPVREALPEIEGQGFFGLLDNVFKTGEPYIGKEIPVLLQREPDAVPEERFVDFVYQPVFEGDDSVSGIFVHGIDITDQVQARKDAEEANRAKDEFLATLSHELRTPLNAILGWSKMMTDGRLDDDARRRALETIHRSARLQAGLIEDILDVSRIISGKLKLEVRPVELSSIVESAVESVLPAAQAKEIRLQRVLDSGSSMVSGDPSRLQQVIWNILSNAVKFTPKRGRIQIRLERINSHVEIIVTDTGIGISPEILPYIFDRFRQADSATTRKSGGLGLGLAIVRHLVEMHGGTVEAESDGEGHGSTFTVKLPLIALRSVDLVTGSAERVHPNSNSSVPFDCVSELDGLRILVVDDEEDGRALVTTVLEQCGATVMPVDSAQAALKALREERFDILLSDIGMPGEDGYSLIRKVRALSSAEGGNMPAAALTAYARVEDRMRVLRSGFQIHLPKPVEPAELVAVVANLAGRHDKD
ncbi:MAG TPA: PAS domain S-box protein [Pyrinomonadaceae bacterium]|jgi:PAS domain S-box-containing protein